MNHSIMRLALIGISLICACSSKPDFAKLDKADVSPNGNYAVWHKPPDIDKFSSVVMNLFDSITDACMKRAPTQCGKVASELPSEYIIIDRNGNTLYNLPPERPSAVWSPDGNRVALEQGKHVYLLVEKEVVHVPEYSRLIWLSNNTLLLAIIDSGRISISTYDLHNRKQSVIGKLPNLGRALSVISMALCGNSLKILVIRGHSQVNQQMILQVCNIQFGKLNSCKKTLINNPNAATTCEG